VKLTRTPFHGGTLYGVKPNTGRGGILIVVDEHELRSTIAWKIRMARQVLRRQAAAR
jgi:hypothetical protein